MKQVAYQTQDVMKETDQIEYRWNLLDLRKIFSEVRIRLACEQFLLILEGKLFSMILSKNEHIFKKLSTDTHQFHLSNNESFNQYYDFRNTDSFFSGFFGGFY